jgi:hypothetical protein
MSSRKEINFFANIRNYKYGLEWYESHFDPQYRIRGEASPLYTKYPRVPDSAELIYRNIPDAKLIYLVRDPIDRVISHYMHSYRESRDLRSFQEVIDDLEGDRHCYFHQSRYHLQLSQYLRFFDRNQIGIFLLEELSSDPAGVLKRVFAFLGVPEEGYDWRAAAKRHNTADAGLGPNAWLARHLPGLVSGTVYRAHRVNWRLSRLARRLAKIGGQPVGKPQLTAEMEERLMVYFRNDVMSFADEFGIDISCWRSYGTGSAGPRPGPAAPAGLPGPLHTAADRTLDQQAS